MIDVVVDASVVAKLFAPGDERHLDQAAALGDAVAGGRLRCRAPQLLMLEVLNVAARKWLLGEPALRVLVASIEDLGIELVAAEHGRVAAWASRGLSAYDAAYVAVAEAADLPLVTDDDQIARMAPDVAVSLAAFDPS
jgi:predicted nucleic acid-binding protein